MVNVSGRSDDKFKKLKNECINGKTEEKVKKGVFFG